MPLFARHNASSITTHSEHMGAEQRDSFLEAARHWVCEGYFFDVRYVAYEGADRVELLRGALALNPLPPKENVGFSLSAAGLVAGQFQSSASSYDEMLTLVNEACSGRLSAHGHSLSLVSSALDFYSENVDQGRAAVDLHLRVGTDQQGGIPHAALPQIESALRWAETPFDGLTDLCGWLGVESLTNFGRGPYIDVRINPPVDFAMPSGLEGDVLTLRLHALKSYDTRHVRLAIRSAPGRGLARSLASAQIIWKPGEEALVDGIARIECPNADMVVCMLGLGGSTVRRQLFVDKSRSRTIRLAALKSLDHNLEHLQAALIGGADSKRFEKAVEGMLFLYGFAPVGPVDTDAPDLLVMSPAGRLAIVECTLRANDLVGKVGKLAARRNKLVDDLAVAGHSAPVQAFLVCGCAKKDLVGARKEELAKHSVTVLAREDLVRSLDRVQRPVDPDGLLEQAQAQLDTDRQTSVEPGG